MPPLADLYGRLAQALAGSRWYLFGARAAIHYGSVRGTVDVDIALALDDSSIDELLGQLARHGMEPRIADWRSLMDEARVLLLLDRESGTEVDLVLTGPGVEEEFHARIHTMRVGTVDIPVISPEDLLIGKILAGRPQDLQDVEAVLAVQDPLDLERVRRILHEFEQALARSDLLPLLDALTSKRS